MGSYIFSFNVSVRRVALGKVDSTKICTVYFGNRQQHFFTAIHVRIFIHLTRFVMQGNM